MKLLYEEFLENELGLKKDASPSVAQSKLYSDSNYENIEEGFDIYSLLNLLGEVIGRVRESLENLQVEPAYKNCYIFYQKNTGKIEVNILGDIQVVFFRIQPKCWFLTQNSKEKFVANVPRETQQEKNTGLLS